MTVCVCVSLWEALQEPSRPELPLYTLSPGRGGGRGPRGDRGTTHSSPAWRAEVWVTLVLRERDRERGRRRFGCMPCSMCVFVQKDLSLSFYFYFFIFLIFMTILNPKCGITFNVPDWHILAQSDIFIFIFVFVLFCFFQHIIHLFFPANIFITCFLLCTRHRVRKHIQQVRFVSCHSFICLDRDLLHHQPVLGIKKVLLADVTRAGL